MFLDTDVCYRALLTHDPRFDGAFFVAVSSTGVYCRTVCTARTPSLKNCSFFQNAAAAETAGFRPCLRCRPELAPGHSRVDAIDRAAYVISDLIEEGLLNEMTVSELADYLDLSQRQLRRVVEASFGVSPLALAQTQRLLLAKRLLNDSNLSMTEVAFASGFASLRRFNALIKEKYGLSPSQLRRHRSSIRVNAQNRSQSAAEASEDMIVCQLAYREPFDWLSLLSYLQARSAALVELVHDDSYFRTVRIGKDQGFIRVELSRKNKQLELAVSRSLCRKLMPIIKRVKRVFDLNADPLLIEADLGKLARSHPGLRVPGAFDGFETAVRGILGQQVSIKAATTLMARFSESFGSRIETPIANLSHVFPAPEHVAKLDTSQLQKIGIIFQRANTIIALAKAVSKAELSLEHSLLPEKSMAKLQEISGIGDWTANYIAMRCFSWPDAFPATDLGIYKALAEKNKKIVLEIAEKWRPWRAYAAMHLWKSLED